MEFRRYRIVRPLARRGATEVYEAVAAGDLGFERKVVLKVLGATDSELMVDEFAGEARLLAQLHHPNVVRVIDFGVADGQPFQVLELVDGSDLEALAQRALPPTAAALWITAMVARGLDYAHKAKDREGRPLGLVHRDISPDNVLLSWSGEIKLSDFGVAWSTAIRRSTDVGVVKGKLSWMSPEQCAAGRVDSRSDIYSLGLVLNWLLTGSNPLAGLELRSLVQGRGELPLDTDLEPEVAQLLRMATKPKAGDRLGSAEAFGRRAMELARRATDPEAELMTWLSGLKEPTVRAHPLEQLMGFGLEGELQLQPGTERHYSVMGLDARPAEVTVINEPPVEPTVRDRAPSDSEALEGLVLHGYRLEALIGRGALALVFRARHLVLKREYAVKVLSLEATVNERSVRRLEREAQVLAELDHPGVVKVIDFGATPDGRPFLTMELLKGVSLAQVIKEEGAQPPGRVAKIGRQIASALAAAHAAGVVHRDLKPANVMLLAGDGVKVLDFGLARLAKSDLTRLTATDFLLGTPRFMAPEQITQASDAGPPADMYSLGALLYTLLGGKPPFDGQAIKILEQHLRAAPAALTTQSGLEPLVMRLLSKRPEDRPDAATVFEALSDYTETEAEPAPTAVVPLDAPPFSVTSSGLTAAKNRLGWPLVAAAGTLALVGIGVGWWVARPQPVQVPVPLQVVPVTPVPVTPVASPAPQVVPVAVASEKEAPQPEAVAPETVAAPKERKPRKVEVAEDWSGRFGEALAGRGFSRRDLPGSPLSPLVQALDARPSRDAYESAVAALLRPEVARALLQTKLTRVRQKLAQAQHLPASVFEPFEDQYLELRAARTDHADQVSLVATRLHALELALDRQLKDAP